MGYDKTNGADIQGKESPVYGTKRTWPPCAGGNINKELGLYQLRLSDRELSQNQL